MAASHAPSTARLVVGMLLLAPLVLAMTTPAAAKTPSCTNATFVVLGGGRVTCEFTCLSNPLHDGTQYIHNLVSVSGFLPVEGQAQCLDGKTPGSHCSGVAFCESYFEWRGGEVEASCVGEGWGAIFLLHTQCWNAFVDHASLSDLLHPETAPAPVLPLTRARDASPRVGQVVCVDDACTVVRPHSVQIFLEPADVAAFGCGLSACKPLAVHAEEAAPPPAR